MRSFACNNGLPGAWVLWWTPTGCSPRPPVTTRALLCRWPPTLWSTSGNCTACRRLPPGAAASRRCQGTPTSLPLLEPPVSIHFLLEQGTDGDRLAAIHAGQRLQPRRVGHRAFDRHGLHAVSQQPDGAGDPVGEREDRVLGHVDALQHLPQQPAAPHRRFQASKLTADGGQRHRIDTALHKMLVRPMELAVQRPGRGALMRHLWMAAGKRKSSTVLSPAMN